MEEETNNQETASERCRSNEDITADKDAFSGSDSGKQSPLEKDEGHQQQFASSNDNNSSCNNHINNNNDSGLSFKTVEQFFTNEVDENLMSIILDSEKREDHHNQQMLTDDNNQKGELVSVYKPGLSFKTAEPFFTNEVDENLMSIIVDSEKREDHHDQQMLTDENNQKEELVSDYKPTSSTSLIKRHKRDRSRNYRVAGRSSSSSSNSSNERHMETHPEQNQEQDESLENNAAEDPDPAVSNNSAELPSPTSPYNFLSNFHDSSSSSSSSSSDSSTDSNDDDTDFEPSLFGDRLNVDFASNDSAELNHINEREEEVNKVLNKQKPAYSWYASYELMRREHGLNSDRRTSMRNGFSCSFNKRFYASRYAVERMKISHVLRKHSGCVNCVNFNKTGDLLVTGSDDARLIVWDWAGNKTKHVWKSGHSANIFQSKFLPSSSCIDIVSAGRDGKVKRSIIAPFGGKEYISQLYSHSGAVHKLVICPDNPSEIISVGEDGCICNKDLREDTPKVDMLKVFLTTKKTRRVRLFSISHHPFAPEICVSGSDQYVRVYDKRSMLEPVHTMSPEHILETHSPNITCCVYNNTGTEILATYSEDNIYLFDNKNYVPGGYLHSYKGHFNQKTIKGVNFFGPNSECVISGSDCGNIFYWDKNSEAILNFMPGDTAGVVNCLEPHPNIPILATSGLDHNIKIWTPSAEKLPPDLKKLPICVWRNTRKRSGIDYSVNIPMHILIRQILSSHINESDSDSIGSDYSSILDIYSENDDTDDDLN